MDPITQFVVQHLVGAAAKIIMPLMLLMFAAGVFVRVLMFYYARVQNQFCLEFEKRVRNNIEMTGGNEFLRPRSFQIFVSDMLKMTYFESFELRTKKMRRNFDHVSSLADRLFLLRPGVARAVDDTKRLIRYLRRESTPHSRMMEITKSVFDTNPYFTRLIGVFPMSLMHELTNILPGLFIIGGIFGTFLGISKGLPELGNMDLAKLDEAKHIMDAFLVTISQSMVKSIVGIALSVIMSLVNTFFAPDTIYYNALNRFAGTLDTAWNETVTNEANDESGQGAALEETVDKAA
jgi:hypothetical protein